MTVKEFCKKYSLKYQTVYKKISHHKNKELAGHITKIKGESIDLDDYAVDFLLPISVKIIQAVEECEIIACENDELKDKLAAAEFDIKQTESRLTDAIGEITKLTADLSYKANQLSECRERNKQLETQCEEYCQRISVLEKSIAELTKENSTLKAQLEAIPRLFRKNQ